MSSDGASLLSAAISAAIHGGPPYSTVAAVAAAVANSVLAASKGPAICGKMCPNASMDVPPRRTGSQTDTQLHGESTRKALLVVAHACGIRASPRAAITALRVPNKCASRLLKKCQTSKFPSKQTCVLSAQKAKDLIKIISGSGAARTRFCRVWPICNKCIMP